MNELDRLGDAVRQRRQSLGLTITGAAKAAGISHITWIRVEKGEPVRPLTWAAVERTLRWAPGSCRAAATGGEPRLIDEPAPLTDRAEILEHGTAEAARRWAETDPRLTPGERAAFLALVDAVLERSTRSEGEQPDASAEP